MARKVRFTREDWKEIFADAIEGLVFVGLVWLAVRMGWLSDEIIRIFDMKLWAVGVLATILSYAIVKRFLMKMLR